MAGIVPEQLRERLYETKNEPDEKTPFLINELDKVFTLSRYIDDSQCSRCKCSIYHNHQTFHCHHPYCMKCSAVLINESLLLLNAIPHCLICDNPLNMYNIHQKIQSLLLPAYQINNQFSEYNVINALIVGFIRTKIHKSAPNEIISSISDFYKLLYCKKIICPNCDCIGYK
eukprot:275695_1